MSRKLDAAIATALGNKVGKDQNGIWIYEKIRTEGILTEYVLHPLLHYSTDSNAMLELDSEMRKLGYNLKLAITEYNGNTTFVAVYNKLVTVYFDGSAYGENELEARSKAAYKALTGKEWEGEGE